jgi:hypothetical protein
VSVWFWRNRGFPTPTPEEDPESWADEDTESFLDEANRSGHYDTTGGEIVLEVFQDHQVSIVLRDTAGLAKATVNIGDLDQATTPTPDAEHLAGAAGWTVTGDWVYGDDYDWVEVKARPLTLKFVGKEFFTDQLLNLARASGYPVTGVVEQHYDEEHGTTSVSFDIDEPHGWDWKWGDWFQ